MQARSRTHSKLRLLTSTSMARARTASLLATHLRPTAKLPRPAARVLARQARMLRARHPPPAAKHSPPTTRRQRPTARQPRLTSETLLLLLPLVPPVSISPRLKLRQGTRTRKILPATASRQRTRPWMGPPRKMRTKTHGLTTSRCRSSKVRSRLRPRSFCCARCWPTCVCAFRPCWWMTKWLLSRITERRARGARGGSPQVVSQGREEVC